MQQGRPWPVVLAREGMVNTGSSTSMSVGNHCRTSRMRTPKLLLGGMSGIYGANVMKKEDLKAEAKRLRSAIAEMFGIHVSASQSLELIAKVKNFPNWDAASWSAIQADYILRATAKTMLGTKSLEELGFTAKVLGQIRAMLAGTAGLYLVAGPTGSGRSTTLAAMMLEAVAKHCKVATLESPVERGIAGASQYDANRHDWCEKMRIIMRSSPDVVMMHNLYDPLSVAAATENANAGTQVWAGITSRVASLDAVMEALRAIDLDGRAANLVRGVIWQSLTDDGRIEARILLQTPQDQQTTALKSI